MKILGFDIGNTSTTMGIYGAAAVPENVFRYPTEKKITAEKLAGLVRSNFGELKESAPEIGALVFSSVVNELDPHYKALAAGFGAKALGIDHRCRLSIRLKYRNPAELGPDRIVNAEAAFRDYGGGLIIIDIGTAVTFCVLSENGDLQGGLIAPGIGSNIQALKMRTSRLPEIVFGRPDKIVADDTVNALKSGFFYGWISMVDGIIDKISGECRRAFRVVITGGYSEIISENIRHENTCDPLLTMRGIKYVYDLNAT